MRGMTLRRIADECGGILHVREGLEHLADKEVSAVVTDSRKAGEGSLFAAIRGERADGHSFIPQVFAQGAVCVLCERQIEDAQGCWIQVPSTLAALRGIAEYYLRVLDIPVVGVTGSVGKTSTKEMIASVLASKYRVHKTKGNFNNELGLPLTVFELREEHEIAVLEMGISHFGEMHRLAQIARPDTCVITNIGECHLEFLRDRDGVLRAKTEIFDFLRDDGYIVLNGNDDRLLRVRNVKGVRPVFFGIPQDEDAGRQAERAAEIQPGPGTPAPELAVYAEDIAACGLEGSRCRIRTMEGAFSVTVPIPGRHMVMNALAGTAVGLHYGLTLEQIRAGIENVERVGGRLNLIHTKDYTLIDDCYNANPVSMEASLEVLKEAEGGKAAILGDMFELGEEELALHRRVGECAACAGIDALICIGERSRAMYEGARQRREEEGRGLERLFWFESVEEFLPQREACLRAGDTVLVKASHAMGFERILDALSRQAAGICAACDGAEWN